jgi:cytochrome c-type biogenesis protein CcmH
MTLWLILALMTAAAILAVIWPLAPRKKDAPSGSDVVVYRDQLEEVDRDLAAGLIGKTEAQAARVEISRRLLTATDNPQTAPTGLDSTTTLWHRRALAIVALVLLPLFSAGLYLRLGSPELDSEPVAARRDAASNQQASLANLIAKVEDHLERNPRDGRGWEVLAPVYMRIGRYSDAVRAWRNTLQLLGEDADREANLGEALMAEAKGIVTADAKAAFVRAVALDKTTVSARYYLGVAAEQDGKREEAATIWRDLIAEAPTDAHWIGDVRTALARIEGKAAPAPAGPTAAQMADAAKKPPEQQAAMIRGMVEGLAARLKKDGNDIDGWVRLVRSYKVLGEPEKAETAINDARRAVADDPDKRRHLDAGLKELEGAATAATVTPGPTTPDAGSSPAGNNDQNSEMIRGMVARLADRLKKDGSDFDGWMRLVRSYVVLGERDKAMSAVTDARLAIGADADKRRRFDDFVKSLGLEG